MRRRYLRLSLALLLTTAASALSGTQLHAQTMDALRIRIAAIATEEGFEPATALALVAIESAFDTAAVGKGGPLGLMQIKLGTAALMMPGVTRTDLLNPEINVRLGLRYLQSMMDQFDGDLDMALRAYKTGPRAAASGNPPTAATISYIDRFRRAQARYASIAAVDTAITNREKKK